MRYSHWRQFVVGSAFVFIAMFVGCSNDNANRADISGRITLDGHPIEKGSILFTPVNGTGGIVTGGEIKAGQYHLPKAKGPSVGKNRIEIRAPRMTGRKIPKGLGGTGEMVDEQVEAVAPKYNLKSALEFNVQPGNNTADFEVTSKAL